MLFDVLVLLEFVVSLDEIVEFVMMVLLLDFDWLVEIWVVVDVLEI